MPKLLHFPWLRRLLNRGVNTDVRPEMMPDGTAREAINVRPRSIAGNSGAAESVDGEQILYTAPFGTGYVLIGSGSCNQRLVEFWASSTPGENPVIRVDGVIVANSENIPYRYDRPLQLAIVDDLYGTSIAENSGAGGNVIGRGIVYPADHSSKPLYWDITQMLTLTNQGDQTYFGSNYSTDINSVTLLSIPEFPIHTRNVELGSGGLPVGQYAYSLRFVTPAGDRTNLGPETPLISVPLKQHPIAPWQQNQYPGVLTIGGYVGEATNYGIEIKFRVDNRFGFSFVEIVRRRINDADNVGQLEVVGKIQIAPGQVSIQEFIDPSDAISDPEVIPDDEIAQRIIAFDKPKSVEYSDRRLTYANFEVEPKVIEVEFTARNGSYIFPITQGVYTRIGEPGNYIDWSDGYSDPVNNTYLKSFARGEKYGLGVMFWDQYSSTSYVAEVESVPDGGYQFPNRLDPKRADSLQFSDDPCIGATTDTTAPQVIEATFDAFTQGSAQKNSSSNPVPGFEGYDNIAITAGTNSFFNPWGPTNPLTITETGTNGNDQTRMSQSPVARGTPTTSIDDAEAIQGAIWAPRHQALGAAISGIINIPDRIKAFSVMRTAPAERVIAQALACYIPRQELVVVDGQIRSKYAKHLNQVRLVVPDFANSVVPLDVIDRFESNPSGFRLQFVRPVGFYTEMYNAQMNDMVSYAGVKFDDGSVNTGLQPASGTQGYDNNVGYGSWRTTGPTAGVFGGPDGGNIEIAVDAVQRQISENDALSWQVVLAQDVYQHEETDPEEFSANDPSYRRFHEPWYVVNIIAPDAEVSNDSIDRYINTGYHIKTESCIGVIESDATVQEFPLLNERRGDVYADPVTFPAPPLPLSSGSLNRYIWVETNGVERPWLCVTDNNEAALAFPAIAAAVGFDGSGDPIGGSYIMQDGVEIFGVYEFIDPNDWTSSSAAQWTGSVQFGLWGGTQFPVPEIGSRIVVKYDKNEPIRFFGGDVTITPSLGLLFNRYAHFTPDNNTASADPAQSGSVNAPIPYRGWLRNLDYDMFLQPGGSIPATDVIGVNRIRQWAVYWDAEQRSALRFMNGNPVQQGPFEWPRMGYIIKPTVFDSSLYTNSGLGGSTHPVGWFQYPLVNVNGVDAVRPDDYVQAGFGGFLWQGILNNNYVRQPSVSGFGVPFDDIGGYEDRRYFPTGMITSLELNPLLQDSPGLRTFLDSNMKVVSEENGEIKVIASALAGGGRNLYAWTERGIVRVLTNKHILSGASGEQVSTQSISNYWGDEMWISRNIGLPDQMWQTFVKGFAPTGDGYADNFFWADRNSVYRMVGDSVTDIARDSFLAFLLPIITSYPTGYVPGSNGFYNRKFNEAWMSFNINGKRTLVVYNPAIDAWNGLYTYQFDGFTQVNNNVFGHRLLQTFDLDTGSVINGATRPASITVPIVGDIDAFKEFIRWRVIGSKPDKIQILDPDENLMCEMPNPLSPPSPLWVKEYDGWEGWADRVLSSYDPTRKLPQKQYFYLRLVWNTPGRKQVTALSAQLKPIK